ncbi:MAG: nucleoside hydrolase [Promethearchaeota archaeon]|nr:MAG: nucleoside hydrolase [Candidatus Lokiarchaeota archaeon]
MTKIPVIIDSDPAITVPFADVDDALAIFLALNSDKLEVDGITTVFGNTHIDNAFRIAGDLLKVAQRPDIPLFKGAYNGSWLGVRTPAVKFIIDQVMEHPGEITLVTLAPLTNVASAFLLEPRLVENLKSLLMMGGYFFPQNFKLPLIRSEFNFSRDAMATRIVLDQDLDTTIIGLDTTTQVLFSDLHFVALQRAQTPITDYLAKNIKSWLIFNKIITFGAGFNPHDPICIAYLLQKSLFKYVNASVQIYVSERKKSNNYIHKQYSNDLFHLLTSLLAREGESQTTVPFSDSRLHKIKISTHIHEKNFLKLLISKLSQDLPSNRT